jgi:tuftelin-interacting protein 11
VGQYAQDHGLEFLPRAGRLHDGLPVYSFGGVSCVVDASRGVIRAQLKDRGWVPVSLEALQKEAMSKAGQR